MTKVYTIGHSNLRVPSFVALLKKHDVEVVVDVRSAPYSAWATQFNKSEIQNALTSAGFQYIFAGDKLGGKPADESLYTPSGVPDYERLAQNEVFTEGLDWLVDTAQKSRVAIMCSEADAFTCHRERLIGRSLRGRGVDVLHITSDGEIAVQEQGSLF